MGFMVSHLAAQKAVNNLQDSSVIISNIIVSGNKQTKTSIILREIFFKEGDTIPANQLEHRIAESKSFIFNTTLFLTVDIETSRLQGNRIAVIVWLRKGGISFLCLISSL